MRIGGGEVLTFDDIVAAAQEKTGDLPAPDSDSWRDGLEILLRDHAQADRLTERGRQSVRARYVSCLAAPMAVDDFHRRNPPLAKAEIRRPVFILGMPRTGTTLLSALMASDPANRSMLRWEAYSAAPPRRAQRAQKRSALPCRGGQRCTLVGRRAESGGRAL